MLFSFAMLLILSGLAVLGFGLFLFYAWLPIFYGLFGFEIGLLLGRWLSGAAGLVSITLGIVCALILAGAAYVLEPYRRIVLGYSAGAVVALSLASLFGLDRLTGGIFGAVVAVAGGVFGAMIASRFFDLFVVSASAFGGATLVMAGAQMLLPSAGEPAMGSFLSALLTVVLAAIGIRWQLSKMATWVPAQLVGRDLLADPVSNQAGSGKL